MAKKDKEKWIGNFKKVKRRMANIGLKAEVHKTKRKHSENYFYLNFLDRNNLIKWKIIPEKSGYISLFHKNEKGVGYGFHPQNRTAWKNYKGLNKLLFVIEEHLLYEE